MIKINDKAPMFETMAFHDDEFKQVSLKDYEGKFVVLFFYPADFTFVCPTELEDMAENYEALKELDCEVLSLSTDTHFVHRAWFDESPKIKKIKFPMLADPTHKIANAFNVLRDDEGVADRATFVIDPEGFLQMIEITPEGVGRNAKELVRKIRALKYIRDNPGQVCPANWERGKETLKPSIDLVGKL